MGSRSDRDEIILASKQMYISMIGLIIGTVCPNTRTIRLAEIGYRKYNSISGTFTLYWFHDLQRRRTHFQTPYSNKQQEQRQEALISLTSYRQI